ncbi:MAG: MopE-related protein [Bacteroidota bacterium]
MNNFAQNTNDEDKDRDGVTVGQGDCDDYQPLVYPGANEIEDGQDNDCDGIIDAVEGDCDDFTSPGEIGGAEIICQEQLPSLITNITPPSGGTGARQIMWIYTTDDPEKGFPEWYIIPNAHELTYQPSILSQTTWFGRCVRRAGCWKFPNESNIIKKEVQIDCASTDCGDFLATISTTTFPDCDGNLGSATIDISGGNTPYQFAWSDGTTTQNRSNLAGGNYDLTVTDANDCQQNLTVNIATPDCPIIPDCSSFSASISETIQPDCNGNLGAVSLSIANGVAPFIFEWSDGNTQQDRTNLIVGNYDVTINDADGCGTSVALTIVAPTCDLCLDFGVSVAGVTSPDCEGNFGTIDLTVTNGLAPYVFNWSDGVTTQNRSGLEGGFYEVTVMDANDCEIILPPIGIATPTCVPDCSQFGITLLTSTNPDCNGNLGSINIATLNASMPIIYAWSDGATTQNRTGLQGGNYQLTATDANGCADTIDVSLPTPTCAPDCSQFFVSVTNSTSPDCNGNLGTINVAINNGTIPIAYVWSDGATTQNRSGLQGGNYQLIATDANGCADTIEVSLPTPTCAPDCSQFSVTVINSTSPDCDGNLGTINVAVNSGTIPIAYAWSDGAVTQNRSGLQGGNYQLTATDANGCTDTIEVNLPTPTCAPDCSQFSVTVTNSTSPDCDGNLGTINVAVNSGTIPIAYAWSDGAITQNRSGLQGGNYQLTATDANGCTDTIEVSLPTPTCAPDCSQFSVTITNSTSPDCDGNLGTISVAVNNGIAPISYAWSDGAITQNRSGLQGGSYQLTATDANGCTGNTIINLSTPNCTPICGNFSVEVESTTFPDCEGNLGSINLVLNNATEPVSYQWSDGAASQNRTNLLDGFYGVTVTDANNCLATLPINIATPNCSGGTLDCNAFTAQLISSTRPDCDGNLGAVNISFVNGIAPVTYAWSDGATTQNRTDLMEGKYQVTLTDANGCTNSLEVSLTAPNCSTQCVDFAVTITETTLPDCADNLGAIDLTVENGASPITYNWQDGATTEDRTALTGGTYAVTVSDANGCFQVVEVPIAAPNCGVGCDNFIIPFTVQDAICAPNNGAIDVSTFGGTAPYVYTWSDIPDNIADRNGLTAGTYELTVTDFGGCSKTASIVVGTGNCSQEVTPFDCPSAFFQIVEGQFNQVDLANDSLIPLGEEAANLNPLGYNVEDDFIYSLQFGTTNLLRIGSNGKREQVGRIQGINVGIIAGDFDLSGNFYLLDNEANRLQRVAVSSTVLVAATVELSADLPTLEDISFNPVDQLFYGVSSDQSEVYTIDPTNGTVNSFTVTGLPASGSAASTWMTSKGEFVVSYNVTADIYQIDLDNKTALLIGNTGDSAANADGVNCVQAPSLLPERDATFRFTEIDGTTDETTATIRYTVENEGERAHYVLEHSIDGQQFKSLANSEIATGALFSKHQIVDERPLLGNGFYRVKYIEENGDYVYSDLVPILFKPTGTLDLIVHPNPFREDITLNFLNPLLKDAQIIVANNLGKIMEVCSAEAGATRMIISCPNYPPGVYTIHVKHGRKVPIVYRTLKVE